MGSDEGHRVPVEYDRTGDERDGRFNSHHIGTGRDAECGCSGCTYCADIARGHTNHAHHRTGVLDGDSVAHCRTFDSRLSAGTSARLSTPAAARSTLSWQTCLGRWPNPEARRHAHCHTGRVTDEPLIRQPEHVYAQAIIDLADIEHVMTTSLNVPPEKAEAAALGFGWWVRITHTADAVRRLHGAGLSNEASPLVRAVLLHWIALAWLCQQPDEAVVGVNFADARWKQRFVNNAAGSATWKLKNVKLGPPPAKEGPVGWGLLNDVEALCERAGTRDTYLPYTLESPYSHPSLTSSQSYVRLVDGEVKLHNVAQVDGVSLRVVANAAAVATKLLGEFIEDAAMVAKAEAVAGVAHLPLAFGDAAPPPVEPDA